MSKDCASVGISRLKELTEKLPSFPLPIDPVSFRGEKGDIGKTGANGIPGKDAKIIPLLDNGSNGYIEYKMNEGDCFAWFIHRSGNEVAVHRWFNSKGTKFPEHIHPEKEYIVIYKGIMELIKNGEKHILEVGDFVYNEPLIIHSAFFPEDCKYITVTIPPSKEFPNASR